MSTPPKLFGPDAAHWYRANGTPLHTVPSRKDGQPRPTTLGDARKLGLLPSVTNIIGVIAKPELISWQLEQAVVAALTLPRLVGEPEDAFAKRVAADVHSARDGAVAFGTAFHHGAQRVAEGFAVDASDPLAPWLTLYQEWVRANCVRVLWTEQVLVNKELGYAGTADLLIEHVTHGLTLVDLKTQGVRASLGPSTYKSWGYQLAAYRRALGQPVACLNLIVNSREPHAPVEAAYSEEELARSWRAFEAARQLWVVEKGYEPAGDKLKAESACRTGNPTEVAA